MREWDESDPGVLEGALQQGDEASVLALAEQGLALRATPNTKDDAPPVLQLLAVQRQAQLLQGLRAEGVAALDGHDWVTVRRHARCAH